MAGIGNRDHGIATWLDKTVLAQAVTHGYIGALQRELATFWHGILGIDDQIHDDLLELPGVGAGVSGVRGKARDQFDILADQRPQQALHIADDTVDVDHLELEELLSAECQQLPGEACGAVGCLLDALNFMVHGAGRFQLLQQHLGVSVDHHQQIVEVVGYAAGEAADGVHLLRLSQLFFQLAPVGNVFGHQLEYFFRFIATHCGAATQPHDDDPTVLAFPLHFDAI